MRLGRGVSKAMHSQVAFRVLHTRAFAPTDTPAVLLAVLQSESDSLSTRVTANVIVARSWSGMVEKSFSSRVSDNWHLSGQHIYM